MISTESKLLLAALSLRGVGPVRVRALVDRLGADLTSRSVQRELGVSASDWTIAEAMAEEIVAACGNRGILAYSVVDKDYPRRLKDIADPPVVLYGRGDWQAVRNQFCVAVVGTRGASDAGMRAAEACASAVCVAGGCVVSGLAFGIDAAAHEGALKEGGQTVAVLAHGLDSISPRTHEPLADRILQSGGLLVSEHPPGVPPRPPEFVRRNRIQSGVSVCSVVVESGVVGGAIHQAEFARRQGRLLLAMRSRTPGSGLNEAGAEILIRDKAAVPVYGAQDVIDLARRRVASAQADPIQRTLFE